MRGIHGGGLRGGEGHTGRFTKPLKNTGSESLCPRLPSNLSSYIYLSIVWAKVCQHVKILSLIDPVDEYGNGAGDFGNVKTLE